MDRLAITPTVAIGFVLLLSGGVVRKICYNTMSMFYTFQLAVPKDYKLLKSGLYAVVRHAGYGSSVPAIVGSDMIQLLPGLYFYE